MTISDIDTFIVKLDANLAHEGYPPPVCEANRSVQVPALREISTVDLRPQTVADLIRAQRRFGQGINRYADDPYEGCQCADDTYPHLVETHPIKKKTTLSSHKGRKLPPQPASSDLHQETSREAASGIALRRPQKFGDMITKNQIRKPKRKDACLDLIALDHTWSGTKSKRRKDKLSSAQKFVSAVWSTAARKGVILSLNLGFRRESMLMQNDDPHRRMMQSLNLHLSKAGFRDLPYAFVFELTPAREGGRLHLHGVIDTAGLSAADTERLHGALRAAGSYASGAIGGERQLHTKPLYDPVGWSDYLLKDATRTAKELDIDDVFMMNNSMRSAAKNYFEALRNEVQLKVKSTNSAHQKDPSTSCKETKKSQRGFTGKPISDTNDLSGERDKKVAGGVPQYARRQPHPAKSPRVPGRPVPMALHSPQPTKIQGSTPISTMSGVRCVGTRTAKLH